MTIPWLMNCPHSSEGWCLNCVKELAEELEDTKADRRRLCFVESKTWRKGTVNIQGSWGDRDTPPDWVVQWRQGTWKSGSGYTLRKAIDDAMEKEIEEPRDKAQ